MPRQTKSARARAREVEKADKALNGPQLQTQSTKLESGTANESQSQVQSQTEVQGPSHFHAELQWFRLLRGHSRLNQIARILVELSPSSVFDPKYIYHEQLTEQRDGCEHSDLKDQNGSNAEKQKGKKGKGKGKGGKGGMPGKGLSRKEQIIASNKAKKQKEAAARDAEKLHSLGALTSSNSKNSSLNSIGLQTDSGKFLLLNQILKKAVKDKDVVDILDTLWEIEEITHKLSRQTSSGMDVTSVIESCKQVLKDNSKILTEAHSIRENIKDHIDEVLHEQSRSTLAGIVRCGFKPKNLVEFQLTCMSDRLPPLNLHALKGKFKLDDWQMRVLKLIDQNKSILITAPTSCGKTVLSTYVCGRTLSQRAGGNGSGGGSKAAKGTITKTVSKTLFVVPTEPLAWQVAAMLRALKLSISLVVPSLTYVPSFYDVIIGTPFSLESTLTKQIGFDFDYAVYDEVHSLNTTGGEALQRLIKLMPSSCKVLALSATIGNSRELLTWWEDVLREQGTNAGPEKGADVGGKQGGKKEKKERKARRGKEEEEEKDTEAKKAEEGEEKVIELVEHKARFINLQRHIWSYEHERLNLSMKDLADELEKPELTHSLQGLDINGNSRGTKDNGEKMGRKGNLNTLHPCLSLSVEYLASFTFDHNDLAFTPVDTFMLYKAMECLVMRAANEETSPPLMVLIEKLKKLKPRKFFGEDEKDRITLVRAKEYEDELKAVLQSLATTDKLACKKVLSSLSPNTSAEDIQSLKLMTSEEEVDVYFRNKVMALVSVSEKSKDLRSLVGLILSLKRESFLPGILFQLDSVRCQSYFDGLLSSLETIENLAYPEYHSQLLQKQKQLQKSKDKLSRIGKPGKGGGAKEDDDREDAEFSADIAIDVTAPHPDFSLSPTGRGIGATEAKNIASTLAFDLSSGNQKGKGNSRSRTDASLEQVTSHPLVKGLRRGIGLYIKGLPSSYLRVVQSYAQSGRLGLVLSDELLGYGVNMPFRCAVFFEDPGSHWLTPLIHQQMSGRAGRRGLDRQGHLIYAGFSFQRLQELLRGELPDIVGKFPLYPTIPLQLFMNRRFVNTGTPLTKEKMIKMCSVPLAQFLQKEKNVELLLDEPAKKVEAEAKVEAEERPEGEAKTEAVAVADEGDGKGGYFGEAEHWIEYFGVFSEEHHPSSSYKNLIPELIWELREFLAESLALEYMIEKIIEDFKNVPVQMNDSDVKLQEKICLIFSLICSRRKAFYFVTNRKDEGAEGNAEGDSDEFSVIDRLYEWEELSETSRKFIGVLGEKEKEVVQLPAAEVNDAQKTETEWSKWKTLLEESQQRIKDSTLRYKLNLMLPVSVEVPLCNMCHSAFQRNQIDPLLPTPVQHDLRERLWALGEVLRISYNVLGRSKELAGLTNVLRKSFVRIRYILDETSERNWNKVERNAEE